MEVVIPAFEKLVRVGYLSENSQHLQHMSSHHEGIDIQTEGSRELKYRDISLSAVV